MTDSEDRLVAILDGIGECFYALDRAWRITVFNRGAEAFFGRPRQEMLGRPVWEALQIRSVPELEGVFADAMAGRASPRLEIASPARPGRWLAGLVFPLPDGIGVSFRDVTDAREDELALRRREAELARVQRIAGVGGLEVDLRKGYSNHRSPEYLALHGLPPGSANEPHEAWLRRIHPADRDRTEREFVDVLKGSALTYCAEYRIVRPSDDETRWISVSAEIERDRAGRAVRLVGAHRDVTDRKRDEAHKELLINELNHRVKNTLATVQSIASQSLRGAASSGDAWPAFEARLMALSRAHDVLTRENWEGADLVDIVGEAVAPYRRQDTDRFHLTGGSVRLPPRAALALAMALQELATNAAKYGALSQPEGLIDVAWSVAGSGSGRRLRLVWRERGGPPVEEPEKRGFGSRLLQTGLARELDGEVAIHFAPAGVVCRIDVGIPEDA